jgi:hypothetical protein
VKSFPSLEGTSSMCAKKSLNEMVWQFFIT